MVPSTKLEHRKGIDVFFILALILLLFHQAAAKVRKNVQLLATGESHGALFPCECSENPVGGFAKRAYRIAQLRKKTEVLLIDAGGFSGGGIYDFYTEGRYRDSVRTLFAMQAMAEMGYDAAALGDEELQYDVRWLTNTARKLGLPLISANCEYSSGEPVVKPFVLVKKGKTIFGITAVTTREKLMGLDTTIMCKEPIPALQKIWKQMEKLSDYQIIVSHLGEDSLETLAHHFPNCDIIINGHRKISVQPIMNMGNTHVMQFGFQGKNIASLVFNSRSKSFSLNPSHWISIDDTLPEDHAIVHLLSPYRTLSMPVKSTIIDVYIMAQCPYGIPFLKNMVYLAETFPSVDLSIWFIGDVNSDNSLHSLNGEAEIKEEMMWLAIQHLYPTLFEHFLYLRVTHNVDYKKAIEELKLNKNHLSKWITNNGKEELTYHYRRSQRLTVQASPTVFMNNSMLDPSVTYLHFADDFCNNTNIKHKPPMCDSIPVCFEDSDCQMKGKLGQCHSQSGEIKDNRCIFNDAVTFTFITLVPDTLFAHPEHSVINTTKNLFPGVSVSVLKFSSLEGKKLISKYDPPSLPFYLFEKRITNSANFKTIESGLNDVGDWFTFNNSVFKKHYFYKREKIPQSIILFIDPLFSDIEKVLKMVFTFDPNLSIITIKPIIYEYGFDTTISEIELSRHSEALRWLVLQNNFSKTVLTQYLQSFSKERTEKSWLSLLKKSGISTSLISEKINQNSNLLHDLHQTITHIEISEPIEFFCNNRELFPVKNIHHLQSILSRMILE